METIQIQVSSELAQQLRSHYNQLPQILALGLHYLKQQQATLETRQKIIAVLQTAGASGPTIEDVAHYLADQEATPWQPIQAEGQPASEIIIAARDSLS
jgi:hypothetical protein